VFVWSYSVCEYDIRIINTKSTIQKYSYLANTSSAFLSFFDTFRTKYVKLALDTLILQIRN